MMQQRSQVMMAHIREKIYKIKKKITNHNGNYQRDKQTKFDDATKITDHDGPYQGKNI